MRNARPLVDKVSRKDNEQGLTTGYLRELAVETGNDFANGFGSARRGRDDVPIDSASTTPILVGGTINGLLRGSGGMDRAHQTLYDAELVVYDLSKGRQAVGRAGRIGYLKSYEVRELMIYAFKQILTTVCLGSYASRLTPQTYMGASAEGAEMITFLAPPFR
jgi:hypothetical protein